MKILKQANDARAREQGAKKGEVHMNIHGMPQIKLMPSQSAKQPKNAAKTDRTGGHRARNLKKVDTEEKNASRMEGFRGLDDELADHLAPFSDLNIIEMQRDNDLNGSDVTPLLKGKPLYSVQSSQEE